MSHRSLIAWMLLCLWNVLLLTSLVSCTGEGKRAAQLSIRLGDHHRGFVDGGASTIMTLTLSITCDGAQVFLGDVDLDSSPLIRIMAGEANCEAIPQAFTTRSQEIFQLTSSSGDRFVLTGLTGETQRMTRTQDLPDIPLEADMAYYISFEFETVDRDVQHIAGSDRIAHGMVLVGDRPAPSTVLMSVQRDARHIYLSYGCDGSCDPSWIVATATLASGSTIFLPITAMSVASLPSDGELTLDLPAGVSGGDVTKIEVSTGWHTESSSNFIEFSHHLDVATFGGSSGGSGGSAGTSSSFLNLDHLSDSDLFTMTCQAPAANAF